MGFMSAASAWLTMNAGYAYWSMHNPGEVILKDDIAQVRARTDEWLARAKELNLIAA
jgi:aspartyl aminopeptidase